MPTPGDGPAIGFDSDGNPLIPGRFHAHSAPAAAAGPPGLTRQATRLPRKATRLGRLGRLARLGQPARAARRALPGGYGTRLHLPAWRGQATS
jgi:hypothetical protein